MANEERLACRSPIQDTVHTDDREVCSKAEMWRQVSHRQGKHRVCQYSPKSQVIVCVFIVTSKLLCLFCEVDPWRPDSH